MNSQQIQRLKHFSKSNSCAPHILQLMDCLVCLDSLYVHEDECNHCMEAAAIIRHNTQDEPLIREILECTESTKA